MLAIFLGLAFLACDGHARRVQLASTYTEDASEREESLNTLSELLLAQHALGTRHAARGRQLSPDVQAYLVPRGGSRSSEPSLSDKPVPKVLFVLGGPGAGKGTQCEKVIEECSAWAHVSAGDCLREALADPTSKDAEMLNSYMKEGKLVPSSVVVNLIGKTLTKRMEGGKTCALIDGFPRNAENQEVWNVELGDTVDVKGCLFFDLGEEEMEKRLIKRGETSGRADDNVETIRKRFATYNAETTPIVESFKAAGKLFAIDAGRDVDSVWESTKAVIAQVEAS